MILCAQCGKKNKNGATQCKYCGYNPSALQANTMSWTYQDGAYAPVQYQQPVPQAGQYYYDADGKAYNVRYDYKVVPVDDDYDEDEDDEEDDERVTLYPYNPTLVQKTKDGEPTEYEEPNLVAWIGYILALFVDILAWPICLLGLLIAGKRDGAKRELCIGGMMVTLLRVLSAAMLLLVWWVVSTYVPSFFATAEEWKMALVKMIFFGWPVAIGSIFNELSPEGSAGKAAGKGFFYFSLAVAVLGILFFDVSWLHLFA